MSPANANIVEARDIVKRFGGVLALDKAEFLCPAGKIVGLLGENGSGKSTLCKILTGNIPPADGEIYYKGQQVRFQSPHEAEKAGMAMIYQSYSLVPDLTVWQNIYLGKEPLKKSRMINDAHIKELAKHYLNMLCPWLDMNMEIRRLSSSDRQLVEIAKALASEPEFLIMDEPTSAIEREQVNTLFNLMRELKDQGVSMVYISHRMHEVEEICDLVVVLRNGRTVGTVDLSNEQHVNDDEIVRLITGKQAADAHQRINVDRQIGAVMLEVEDLTIAGELNKVAFDLKNGEIIGLAGLQGQGQGELMLALAGFKRIDAGLIRLAGESINLNHPKDAINKGIVLVPGDRVVQGLFMPHSVFHNITFPLNTRRGSPWVLPMKSIQNLSEKLVQDLSIKTESLNTPVSFLSGGNAQKVVIAKWLPLSPKLLLLSDPAKGVDVQAKADLYTLVAKIAEKGTTVFVYASDLNELVQICDRIMVMYEGRIVEDLVNEGLDEETLMECCLRSGEASACQ
jgi:ABC-type sugar transport system ATPase subunit